MRKAVCLIALVSGALWGACASAQGATVTIGSPLLATGSTLYGCENPEGCTFVAMALPESEGLVKSPVDGAIVRWRVKAASGSGYAIRALRRGAGREFTGAGTSGAVEVAGLGLEEFDANLPIRTGDYLGLDIPEGGLIQLNGAAGAGVGFFSPTLADGMGNTTGEFPNEPAFNAEVQPAPRVTLASPTSGWTTGGTAVTVYGSDFTGVTGVRFGGVPASDFSVLSEGQLTAIAPPAPSAGLVEVVVTTNAGSSATTGVGFFEYTPPPVTPQPASPKRVPQRRCVVPNLRGKTPKAARRRARRAGCRVGRVKRVRRARGRAGRVVRQRPWAGRRVRARTKIVVSVRRRRAR